MDGPSNALTVFSLVLLVWVLTSVRRSHIRVEYSVSWLAAGIAVCVLAQWDWALHTLASLLGIHYPPAALASIAMGIFLLVLYRISMILSDLKDNNIALAQKVAILEFELRQMRETRGA